MNGTTLAATAAWSYGIAVVAYLAFALRIWLGWGGGVRARLLLAAMLATALWAAGGLASALWMSRGAWLISNLGDTLRYAIWMLFIASLLKRPQQAAAQRVGRPAIPRWGVILASVVLLSSLMLSEALPIAQVLLAKDQRAEFAVRLGLSIFGLMLIEQLFRWTQPQARWSIKPLCVALGGVFAFDLLLYADALLFARLDVDMWVARGVANALVIPFIAVATARNTGWTVDMHLSRNVVFHSTTLVVSGVVLLAIAAAGYFVRYVGGDWGRALQIELIFAALLLFVLVASSGRFRSRVKVFVSKHFFSYRYDYREEWLRFTSTLATDSALQGVHERAVMALANLVESPAGMLWLKDESRNFRPVARWNLPALDASEPQGGSLVGFLERTGWVIDLRELASSPAKYSGLIVPAWLASLPHAWLIIPLAVDATLLGFVVLDTPRASVEVDWEVRDMLKTASRQAASYLEQMRATEALVETRKFDAFNRMSAFVVHDLKNLVAQLSLMLKNAERHRGNPEFERDMLSTVEHVVGRMNKLMLQLRTGATPLENLRPVDLASVVERICAEKSDDHAPLEVTVTPGISAFGHEDRLEHVIAHLVQNAIDATADGGTVTVRLYREDRFAIVEIADTGVGMTQEFIRERLFRPFETTKAAGTGIGVYESKQYVTALGGQLLIESTPKVGTRVQVMLPLGDSAAASSAPLKEVA